MSSLEAIVRGYSEKIKNGRTIRSAFEHMQGEANELDLEITLKNTGMPAGPDGIVGEAIDVISCALDVIFLHKPDITDEELHAIMIKKMEKWVRDYA